MNLCMSVLDQEMKMSPRLASMIDVIITITEEEDIESEAVRGTKPNGFVKLLCVAFLQ